MLNKFLLSVLGVLIVGGAVVGTKVMQFRAMSTAGATMVATPEVVTAATAREDSWERTLSCTGTLAAVHGVTVSAETSGRIVKIAFESGTPVEAGDVLVRLETATEEAQLRAAEAAAVLAKANLERSRDLRARNMVSPAELDATDAQFKQAFAQAESIRTTIAKKTVRAPFSGRLGMRRVDLGEVLSEGDAITSLQTLDPIYVNFALPQQHLAVLETRLPVRVSSDAAPGQIFEGSINAVSPEVDPATHNVQVQATLSNPQERLRGGMFAKVEVVLPLEQQVLIIPVTAVLFAPFGDSVFVIENEPGDDGQAPHLVLQQRFVRLGEQRGDFITVLEGLVAGEQVVSSGVFKLRSAMRVTIDNALAPAAEISPQPDDA